MPYREDHETGTVGRVNLAVLAIAVGALARNKGSSFVVALVVSLSPLVGLVAALIDKPNVKTLEAEKLRTGNFKECPSCAEIIKIEAKACRYCGREV